MSQRSMRLAGGLVLCVLLGAGLGYGLGWLFPVPDRPNYFGSVIETLSKTTSSSAIKQDSDTTTTLVPGMTLTAYTTGEDYLVVEFSAMAYLYLADTFQNTVRFNISLNVANASRCNVLVDRFSSTALGHMEEIPVAVHMKWVSPVLPGGAHDINVTWTSLFNPAGANYLSFSDVAVNMTRTLTVQLVRYY